METQDRIQASLGEAISQQLDMRAARYTGRRLLEDGLRITESEKKAALAMPGNAVNLSVVKRRDHEFLLQRHPDYTDIYYCLDGRCPVCKTEILQNKCLADGRQEFNCPFCGYELEEYEQIFDQP